MTLHRLCVWYRVLYSLLATWCGVSSKIMDADETVEAILKGKSLIRFGDGEFGIYRGKDIHYQKWSEELKDAFMRIKQTFENDAEGCPYILAVPKQYMQCSGMDLCKKRVLVSSWAESRLFFKRNFNLSVKYADAFLFQKGNSNIYSKLWIREADKRTILFVHNNTRYAQMFQKRYGRTTIFVPCPAKNAFEYIEDVCHKIESTMAENHLDANNVQIVVSAGPAGKVVVYRYALKGYSCIDAGHCWDEPLES